MARPLSVLDLTYMLKGDSPSSTIERTVRLAQLAERIGYERVWFAEHHNTRGLASGSPEIMIAHVAAQTERIRVGAGGIMLPNQAPLKAAESFKLLQAMYPDRIDLGIGRAPGTDQKTSFALRRNPDALGAEDYPQNVMELLAYEDRTFPAGHIFENIIATPADSPLPPVWLLGSSDFSAHLSAQLGLGFSFAAHINRPLATAAMCAYRAEFAPSERFDAPHSILAESLVVDDTDERAVEQSTLLKVGLFNLLQGSVDPLPPLDEAKQVEIAPMYQMRIDSMMTNHLVGSPQTVAQMLKDDADASQADEVMISSWVGDEEHRARVLQDVFDAWQDIDR